MLKKARKLTEDFEQRLRIGHNSFVNVMQQKSSNLSTEQIEIAWKMEKDRRKQLKKINKAKARAEAVEVVQRGPDDQESNVLQSMGNEEGKEHGVDEGKVGIEVKMVAEKKKIIAKDKVVIENKLIPATQISPETVSTTHTLPVSATSETLVRGSDLSGKEAGGEKQELVKN